MILFRIESPYCAILMHPTQNEIVFIRKHIQHSSLRNIFNSNLLLYFKLSFIKLIHFNIYFINYIFVNYKKIVLSII